MYSGSIGSALYSPDRLAKESDQKCNHCMTRGAADKLASGRQFQISVTDELNTASRIYRMQWTEIEYLTVQV